MHTYIAWVTIAAAASFIGCDDSHDMPTINPNMGGMPSIQSNPNQNADPYPNPTRGVNPSPFVPPKPQTSNKPNPPTPTNNLIGLKPGEIYVRIYNQKKGELNLNSYNELCLSPSFRLGAQNYMFLNQFNRGSSTRLFATSDDKYALKIQDSADIRSREMFWREHAAMHQARSTNVIPVVEPSADMSSMSVECRSRSYVMSKVAGKDLFGYLSSGLSTARILELGETALTVLEKYHDTGIIHGDIHPGNFVLGSQFDIKNTLKLIDFGRSMTFMDPTTGKHRLQFEMRPFNPLSNLNWNLLSINELEGKAVSRADDIFRLAEVLIVLCINRIEQYPRTSALRVAMQKRTRTFDARVPQKIQDFYRYAMNLQFDERPNYRYLSS